jgi:hypothetical protein
MLHNNILGIYLIGSPLEINTARLRKFQKPKTSERRDISRLYILEITTKNP